MRESQKKSSCVDMKKSLAVEKILYRFTEKTYLSSKRKIFLNMNSQSSLF